MITVQVHDRQFRNIEAIVFDKDGTLANTESYLIQLGQKRSRLVDAQVPGVQEPIQMAFGLEHNALNPEGMLAIASRRECEIATAGFVAETGMPWLQSLNLVQSTFEDASGYLKPKCAHTPLLEGVREMLHRLAQHPVKVAILSSDVTENVEDFIRHHQLGDYIHLGRGVQGLLGKPDPQLLLNLCAELQVKPENTLMVGDSAADIQMAIAAQAAGTVGVTWGWQTPIHLPTADVEATSPSHIQLSAD
jgi:phosphoglycolate phosphatase